MLLRFRTFLDLDLDFSFWIGHMERALINTIAAVVCSDAQFTNILPGSQPAINNLGGAIQPSTTGGQVQICFV